MRQIKNSEEEMSYMCKEVEKYAEKKIAETKIQEVKKLIKAGLTTLAAIKESGLYTNEEMKAIAAP